MSSSDGPPEAEMAIHKRGDHLSPTVCHLCRQRKTKCDRQKPKCSHCIKAETDCLYLDKQKKHGLRAGYVAELEKRLEHVEKKLQIIQETQTLHDHENCIRNMAHQQSPYPNSQRIYHVDDVGPDVTGGNPAQATHRGEQASHSELQLLTPAVMSSLCQVWFKEYQPWCPILDKSQIMANLQSLSANPSVPMDITLKAVLSLVVSHYSPAISLGYDGRTRLSRHLRDEVYQEAMQTSRNSSLQALLILVIFLYGYGDLSEAQDVLSICKSMCFNLGLRKHLLSSHFDWQDEGSRMSWLTAAMESTSNLGATRGRDLVEVGMPINTLPNIPGSDILPQSLVENLNLTVVSLHPIHDFHRNQSTRRQDLSPDQIHHCERLYQDLTRYHRHTNRDGGVASYSFAPDGSLAFDPNKVLSNFICNTAIIALYQPYTLVAPNLNLTSSPDPNGSQALSSTAAHRCLEACHKMSAIISSVADTDIEFICPFLGSFIFTAARFSIVHTKLGSPVNGSTASSTPSSAHNHLPSASVPNLLNHNFVPVSHPPKRSPGFDLLMHALNMCGRRWPLSRRLDIVLRAALVEESRAYGGVTPAAPSAVPPLPNEFYDLRLSGLDVDKGLSKWVEGMKSSVYVGSLNGPYA